MACPKVLYGGDHLFHREIRITDNAGTQEKTFYVVPAVETDRQV
jgi:hypothetical protein